MRSIQRRSICAWACFGGTLPKGQGRVKLHVLFDVNTQIPTFVHFSEAGLHDVNAMDLIPYEAFAYYIFDKAYIDFERLFKIDSLESYFVVRGKSNLRFKRTYSNKVDKSTGIRCDQIGKLEGFYTSKAYPKKIRRIKFFDAEQQRTFVFLTNNFELEPEQVALLYKQRWQIELFFKWIKQHLKIKSFWGTTENAVRIQINAAIITYCLVSILRHELKPERSTYEILQILGVSLLDKTPVNQLIENSNYNNVNELNYNQLKMNLF